MSGFYRAPITPGQTWFSPVGGGNVPAAGGTITTYLAGTTTLVATYADNAGGTSNGSTITLNAAGRLPTAGAGSDVWIPGGVAIKMVILDSVGNPINTVDNIVGVDDPAFASANTGEWIAGPAATWLASAASAAGTRFSLAGDQRANFQPNRRVRIVSANGDLAGSVTASTFGGNLTTVTVDMDRNAAGAYPTVANPITALHYAIENTGGAQGLAAGVPSRALELGFPRYPGDGSARTGVDLYGPVGSNIVTFNVPPNAVGSAGGAGNQIVTGTVNGVAGSLTFNKTAHGRTTGEVVRLTTSNTLPGGTAINTNYIVYVVDANNFGLYAVPSGWEFRPSYLSPGNPGGLSWGNPIAFATAGVGTQTATPHFVAPKDVTRVWEIVTGGGGGGAGSTTNTNGGGGGGGGGSGIGWASVIPGTAYAVAVGAGGAGGAAAGAGSVGGNSTTLHYTGNGGTGGSNAGVPVDGGTGNGGATVGAGFADWTGDPGGQGQVATGNTWGGKGGNSYWGGGGRPGAPGANAGQAATNPGGGGGGAGASGAAQAAGGAGSNGRIVFMW